MNNVKTKVINKEAFGDRITNAAATTTTSITLFDILYIVLSVFTKCMT